MAELLGTTVEELREELQEGKTIPGLAERQGVPLQEITEALLQARQQALADAVAEGRLTQEQADRIQAGWER